MSRPFIKRVHMDELEWEAPKGGSVGARMKLLSIDPETGASTRLLSLPPGWSKGDRGACWHEAVEEMFFLSGDIIQDEAYKFTTHTYFYRPGGIVHGMIERSETGCLGLSMFDGKVDFNYPESFPGGKYTGAYAIRDIVDPRGHIPYLDSHKMEWQTLPNGLLQKILSQNKITGAKTSLVNMPPGWNGGAKHFHYCLEEMLIVDGSIIIDDNIAYTAGTYACHPAKVVHGGHERTDEGALIFVKHDGLFESIMPDDVSEESRRELVGG